MYMVQIQVPVHSKFQAGSPQSQVLMSHGYGPKYIVQYEVHGRNP